MDNTGLLSPVIGDSDTLLILALAYILYKQNADRMLILALLSILIG